MPIYHITGIISALLSVLASAGLATQGLLLIKRRRAGIYNFSEGLSINRFMTSYLLFLALFTYGSLLNPFNHYLAWPRFLGVLLGLSIILLVFMDRRCPYSAAALVTCLLAVTVSVLIILLERPIHPSPYVLPLLLISVSALYLLGGAFQIRLILRQQSVGGLSLEMHYLFVIKDLSLAIFAIVMGLHDGWPVLIVCASGLTVNLATLKCFYWTSTLATRKLDSEETENSIKRS
jgi:hypothetical protein